MAFDVKKYVKAVGTGSWGRLELNDYGVVLRIAGIKQAEGRVLVYFGSSREQIVSHGRLYSPMTNHRPYYFRAGMSYQIRTQIEIVKKLPKGVFAYVEGNDSLAVVGGIITRVPIREAGVVEFSMYCTRKAEITEFASLFNLMFVDTRKEGTSRKRKAKVDKSENKPVEEPVKVTDPFTQEVKENE